MKVYHYITALALVFTGMQSAGAQEIVTTGDIVPGTRALGMGGAQIGGANDATAAYTNPAALSRISEFQFQMGVTRVNRKIESMLRSGGFNADGSGSEDNFALGTIGVAYPVPTTQGSLVFSLAYNRVKDFTGRYYLNGFNDQAFVLDNDIWGGFQTEEINEDGGMGVLSFAGAVDVSPNLALGLGIDIWDGTYSVENRVLRNDYDGQVSWLDIVGGKDNISGWSLKPSILYFRDKLRLGAFVRLPMTFKIEQDNYEDYYSRNDGGYFQLHENINPDSGYEFLDSSDAYIADYKIKAPMQLGAGISLGEPGVRSVAADVVYENWSKAEFDDEYDPYYFSDKYRSSFGWRIGGEYMLPGIGTVVRAGYIHQPLSFKGPRATGPGEPVIDVVDDRNFMTIGLSQKIDPTLRIDLGYAHSLFKTREGGRTDEETGDRFYAAINYSISLTPQRRR